MDKVKTCYYSLITSSVSHKQVQKFLPYLDVYHHKQDINQL